MISCPPDRWHALALVAGAWTLYFLAHSLLAAHGVKRWVQHRLPRFWPRYRLAYNLFAGIGLLPPLWLTYRASGPLLWAWQGPWAWLANGLALLALAGFLYTARAYDMQAFLGLGRAGTQEGAGDELGLCQLHRFVRHPWYSLGLVILWTRDMDCARLVATLCATAYLFIGAWFEERKLEIELGERYRDYERRVPGIIPRPWRYLARYDYDRLRGGHRSPD